jgi:hypothetical protein
MCQRLLSHFRFADTLPLQRLVEPIGGDVVNLFEWIAPEAGENDKLLDTATRERLMGIHSKLAAEYERITRQWTSARGSAQDAELTEQRRILVKKLRVSQFGLEPYTRGVTIHHRNGTLVAGNPGIVRWEVRCPLPLPCGQATGAYTVWHALHSTCSRTASTSVKSWAAQRRKSPSGASFRRSRRAPVSTRPRPRRHG